MPQLSLKPKELNAGIALWEITEDEAELARLAKPEVCPKELVSLAKRKEWLAGRILLLALVRKTGLNYAGTIKDEFGKPSLKDINHFISLSHSHPYVAVQIHEHEAVGIDLEQPNEKLLKIAPRILDPIELENAGEDIVKHCIYWCAKEALYKIYGKRGLLFTNHLRVEPFSLHNEGDLNGLIALNGYSRKARLCYRVSKEYVLVYTKTN
jgi:phosphopantetheinyl transferase